MTDEAAPELPDPGHLALQPGATITLMSGSRHMVLESFTEIQEIREGADNPMTWVVFRTWRDFSPDIDKTDPEGFRLTCPVGAIVEVTEITPRLWDRHMQAIKAAAEERAKQPQVAFVQL